MMNIMKIITLCMLWATQLAMAQHVILNNGYDAPLTSSSYMTQDEASDLFNFTSSNPVGYRIVIHYDKDSYEYRYFIENILMFYVNEYDEMIEEKLYSGEISPNDIIYVSDSEEMQMTVCDTPFSIGYVESRDLCEHCAINTTEKELSCLRYTPLY